MISIDNPSVGMAAPSCLAVAGHRSGEVAEEFVYHTVVAW